MSISKKREGFFSFFKKDKIGEVKFGSWKGDDRSRVRRVIEEILLPELKGNDVQVSVPHKYETDPEETSDFQIFIWSQKKDWKGNMVRPPERIWGYEVDCRDDAYTPTGDGVSIIDKDTGYCVAELFGDNVLYIHHDLVDDGTDREIAIFRRLLQEVVAEAKLTPEEKRQAKEKFMEELRKRGEETYVKACAQRFEKMAKATQDSITGGREEIKELQADLVKKIREVKGAEQKLIQLDKAKPDAEAMYKEEYKKFLSVPEVKAISSDREGVIQVFTNMIYVIHDGVKYKIGEFRIDIYINGGNGGIKFFNLTNRGDGPGGMSGYNTHHPHVERDGTPCLGTISSAIPQLIGEYQFAVVAIVAIQYLKSVNVDDPAGAGIYKWPKVEELKTK